ncbi:MAG TPA: Gfo/Idh/MocA family oxidoreductase [Caldilineaceae bacterium]|nr:Gfo/Idh/MocA family oxidoreductase [Caldilineaceae bacterium]
MTSYRVGVIGCGRISRFHVNGYQQAPAVTVVAGAEPLAAIREGFGQEFGVTALYADYHEMLAAEQLDIVSICTWPPLHEEMVIAAAAAGVKGIICEKPMAVNLRQADAMLAACERSGVRLVVNHQRRFNPTYRLARDLVAGGEIGELIQVHGICMGDLLTDGTHNIDLLRFYAGDSPVKWVFAQIDASEVKYRYGHLTERGALVNFEFASGVRGLMELGSAAPRAYQKAYLHGTKGRIEGGGDGDKRVTIIRSGQAEPQVIAPDEENHYLPFQLEVKGLLQTIEQGGEHELAGSQARADLEVLIAAFESARLHRIIELPITLSEHPLEQISKQLAIVPEIEDDRRKSRLGA